MMVGRAVEFSKHQCLSPGICGAHAAKNGCRSTDSGVTTGIEGVRIRHVRLSLCDGWSKCSKSKPANRAQRDRHVDIEIDLLAHNISGPNGWVTQRCALGGAWLACALQHAEQ